MVGNEPDRDEHDVFDRRMSMARTDEFVDVRFEPGLLGRPAAALEDEMPMNPRLVRPSFRRWEDRGYAGGDQLAGFAQLLLIPTIGRHRYGYAVRREDQRSAWPVHDGNLLQRR